MPRLARDYQYQQNYGYVRPYPQIVTPIRPKPQPARRKSVVKKRKRVNPFSQLFSLVLLALLGIYVLPFGFDRISKPLFFGPSYQEVQVDAYEFLKPTSNYLSNDLVLNRRLLSGAKVTKPEMTTIYKTEKMPVVEAKIQRLMSEYKSIDPSVLVWEFDSGKYVDINAAKPYSAASIIKIPVLIQLFKSIEANQLTIYDEMYLTPYFVASGSGSLQTKPVGTKLSIDELARMMITESDNSATNMLMSAVGGMPDVNNGIRSWGLKNTHIQTWLPDLDGTNFTTANDLATMLYNLDNPGFLNINSREYIVDYMSHVHNDRLIPAGLPKGTPFIHKTGDIGTMLGDAGIVYMPDGKKYICVIMANRPYNSALGKDFIQKASKIVYDSIASGVY